MGQPDAQYGPRPRLDCRWHAPGATRLSRRLTPGAEGSMRSRIGRRARFVASLVAALLLVDGHRGRAEVRFTIKGVVLDPAGNLAQNVPVEFVDSLGHHDLTQTNDHGKYVFAPGS